MSSLSFKNLKIGSNLLLHMPIFHQAAKLKSSINNVRGDMLEKQFYESIKSYFENQNENVLVIHSHKLLGLKRNVQKEKDFIVVNLSFGYILNIEVKCSASGSNLNKALEQIKSAKEELGNWFGLAGRWKFYRAIGCESHNQKGQCKNRLCDLFKIKGAENVLKLFESLTDPDFNLDDQHLHEFKLISSYLLFFADWTLLEVLKILHFGVIGHRSK